MFVTDRRRIVRWIDRMGERCHRVNPHLLSSHPLAARRRGEGLRMDELLREEKRRLSSMMRRREERDDRENLWARGREMTRKRKGEGGCQVLP